MEWIMEIENDLCVLSVYECDCGFHIGLDATFIDQVGDILITCPSCKKHIFDTKALDIAHY